MFYTYIKNSGETGHAALKAAGYIDLLTFNRIADFEALSEAQCDVVTRVHEELTSFAEENGELIGSPLKAYSVNGVSMTFGGEGLRSVMGVIVPTDAYSLLVTTGLCCPVI